jgi:hypothetical protein
MRRRRSGREARQKLANIKSRYAEITRQAKQASPRPASSAVSSSAVSSPAVSSPAAAEEARLAAKIRERARADYRTVSSPPALLIAHRPTPD